MVMNIRSSFLIDRQEPGGHLQDEDGHRRRILLAHPGSLLPPSLRLLALYKTVADTEYGVMRLGIDIAGKPVLPCLSADLIHRLSTVVVRVELVLPILPFVGLEGVFQEVSNAVLTLRRISLAADHQA